MKRASRPLPRPRAYSPHISALFFLLLIILFPAQHAFASNYVLNGSFECGDGDASASSVDNVYDWEGFCHSSSGWLGTRSNDENKITGNLERKIVDAAPENGAWRWVQLDGRDPSNNKKCKSSNGCDDIGAIRTRLDQPLEAGKRYVLQFWAATRSPIIHHPTRYGTKKGIISFYLSDQEIELTPEHFATGDSPQVWCGGVEEPDCNSANCGIEILETEVSGDDGEWHKFYKEFVAEQDYEYLAISVSVEAFSVSLDMVSIADRGATPSFLECCTNGPARAEFTLPEIKCTSGDLILDASDCSNEDRYYYEVAEVDAVELPYNNGEYWDTGAIVSGGLVDGSAGVFNLSQNTWISFAPGKVYAVKVAVQNACTNWHELVKYVTVAPEPAVSISPAGSVDLCSGAFTAIASASGGSPPYSYQWVRNYATPLEVFVGIPNYDPTEAYIYHPGTYYVIVTDANGCTAQSQVLTVTGSADCVSPPPGMVGWWHLDEPTGTTAADIAHYTTATHPGTHLASPVVVPGAVENALQFDGVSGVSVPHNKLFNMYSRQGSSIYVNGPTFSGDFSIDAWIKPDALNGMSPIVSKGGYCTTQDDNRTYRYYNFYVGDDGLLKFDFYSGSPHDGTAQFSAALGSEIPVGQWTHVAFTLTRDLYMGATFYVNGQFAGSADPIAWQGPVYNNAPLLIGRFCTAPPVGAGFVGSIDEVEVFQRALNSYEVLDLYNAGSCGLGKCKLFVAGGGDVQFCPGTDTAVEKLFLCNYTSTVASVNLAATSLTPGYYTDLGYCNVPGPNPINATPSSFTVGPGDIKAFNVSMTKDPALDDPWDRSGFQVNGTVGTFGSFKTFQYRGGMEVRDNPFCAVAFRCVGCLDVSSGGTGSTVTSGGGEVFLVDLDNTSESSQYADYIIRVLDGYGQVSDAVSLDGQNPGDSLTGSFSTPAGGTTQIQFDLEATENQPFNLLQVQVLVDHDDDGVFELTASLPLFTEGASDPEDPPGPQGPLPINADAKIMLHVGPRLAKSHCGTYPNPPASQMEAEGQIQNPHSLYFVAVGGLDGIRGAAISLEYDGSPGSGVDVFDWYSCADLDFQGPTWPNSGANNILTWVDCDPDTLAGYENEGAHTLLGLLYVYAYDDDIVQVNPSPNHEGHLADCAGGEHRISPESFAFAGFGASGYNPAVDIGQTTQQGVAVSSVFQGTNTLFVTMDQVTDDGTTILAEATTAPIPLGGNQHATSSALFYELATTATWSGSAEISLGYDESDLTVAETNLRLLRSNAGAWEDVTAVVDTAKNIVCADVTFLSTFVLTQGAASSPEIGESAGFTGRVPLTVTASAPNPFPSRTTIQLSGAKGEHVSVRVFDLRGRLVRTLINEPLQTESQSLSWDARNEVGKQVAAGVYFMAVRGERERHVQKLVLSP